MSTATTVTLYTPDDLLQMPDGDQYELVDGILVERKMSTLSSYVAGELHTNLNLYSREHRQGWAFPEGTGYQCFPGHPAKVRKPDTSYVRRERLTPEQVQAGGYLTVVPDVAAEVVSPNDLYYEVDVKVNEWLEAGVQLVWVINPDTRKVRVYRADGSDVTLRAHDELSGDDVIPGFKCRVGDLFQLLSAATSNSSGSEQQNSS